MPGRTSKYSPRINGEIKMELVSVLSEATDYDNPTLQWIQDHSIYLTGFTPQKLSRSLGELVEMGLVKKGKLKSSGRMVYRLVANMMEEESA